MGLEAAARPRPGGPAAMQDGNFLLSALQPEAGVCSLALPSDLQLDRRGAEGPEAERLRAARVQEQVRARLLQLRQQPRHNGAAEPEPEAETARGRPRRKAGAGRRGLRRGRRWRREVSAGGGGRARAEAAVRLAPDSPGLTLSHAPRPNGRGEKSWVGLPIQAGTPGSSRDRAWPGPACVLGLEPPPRGMTRKAGTWQAGQAPQRQTRNTHATAPEAQAHARSQGHPDTHASPTPHGNEQNRKVGRGVGGRGSPGGKPGLSGPGAP